MSLVSRVLVNHCLKYNLVAMSSDGGKRHAWQAKLGFDSHLLQTAERVFCALYVPRRSSVRQWRMQENSWQPGRFSSLSRAVFWKKARRELLLSKSMKRRLECSCINSSNRRQPAGWASTMLFCVSWSGRRHFCNISASARQWSSLTERRVLCKQWRSLKLKLSCSSSQKLWPSSQALTESFKKKLLSTLLLS